MGSRAVLLLRLSPNAANMFVNLGRWSISQKAAPGKAIARNYSVRSAVDPPDVLRLAETARISLKPDEVEEFAPKIRQVVDWFGQLQAVDLQRIEPAIRAVPMVLQKVIENQDTEGENVRDDFPETFENREAMIAAIPSYEEPYIKVPKVLNKE